MSLIGLLPCEVRFLRGKAKAKGKIAVPRCQIPGDPQDRMAADLWPLRPGKNPGQKTLRKKAPVALPGPICFTSGDPPGAAPAPELGLEQADDRFGPRVAVRVATTSHRRHRACLRQPLVAADRKILDATVRAMDEARCRVARPQCLLECGQGWVRNELGMGHDLWLPPDCSFSHTSDPGYAVVCELEIDTSDVSVLPGNGHDCPCGTGLRTYRARNPGDRRFQDPLCSCQHADTITDVDSSAHSDATVHTDPPSHTNPGHYSHCAPHGHASHISDTTSDRNTRRSSIASSHRYAAANGDSTGVRYGCPQDRTQ